LNWNALKGNRTTLAVVVALFVILISVPVLLWQMGGKPGKEAAVVPAETSVAAQDATKKPDAPMQDKKGVGTVLAEKKESPSETKKTEISPPSPEDPKKAEAPKAPEKPTSLSLGISPWGEVYVDGNKKGVSPPINTVSVTPGKHEIEIRNTTFPPYKQTVDLKPGEQLKIRHKFQ
jgi:serine/threonine-protein kinase